MTSFNDGIEAVVTTDQASRFLECAVRNWSQVSFDRDGLEDFRIELERFRQKVLAAALKRPEPSEDDVLKVAQAIRQQIPDAEPIAIEAAARAALAAMGRG